MALWVCSYSASLVAEAANAEKRSTAVDLGPRPRGRGFEKSIDTKSARSLASSKSALYMSCTSMLPRRMSKMIARMNVRRNRRVLNAARAPRPAAPHPGRAAGQEWRGAASDGALLGVRVPVEYTDLDRLPLERRREFFGLLSHEMIGEHDLRFERFHALRCFGGRHRIGQIHRNEG